MKFGFNLGVSRPPAVTLAGGAGGGGDDLPAALIDINFAEDTYTADGEDLTRAQALQTTEDWPNTPATGANFDERGLFVEAVDETLVDASIALHPDLAALLPAGFVIVLECGLDQEDDRVMYARVQPTQLPGVTNGASIGIQTNGDAAPTYRITPYIFDDDSSPVLFQPEDTNTETRIAARFDIDAHLLEASAMGRRIDESANAMSGSDYSLVTTVMFFLTTGTPSVAAGPATAWIKRARFYPVDDFPGVELQTASIPAGGESPTEPVQMNPDYSMNGTGSWTLGDWTFSDGEASCTPTAGPLEIATSEAVTEGDYAIDFRALNNSEAILSLLVGGVEVLTTADAFIQFTGTVPVSSPIGNTIEIIAGDETTVFYCSVIKVPPLEVAFPIALDFVGESYEVAGVSGWALADIMEASTDFSDPTIPLVVTPGQGIVVADNNAFDAETTTLGVAFVGEPLDLLLENGFLAVFEYDMVVPLDETTFTGITLNWTMLDTPDAFGMWKATLATTSGGFVVQTNMSVSDHAGDTTVVNATAATTLRVALLFRADVLSISVNGISQANYSPPEDNSARNAVGFDISTIAFGIEPASMTLKSIELDDPDNYEPTDLPALSAL